MLLDALAILDAEIEPARQASQGPHGVRPLQLISGSLAGAERCLGEWVGSLTASGGACRSRER